MTLVTSRERVLCALEHRQPDRIPMDFGGTPVTGIHASCVLALRDYFGLEKKPVKVIDPGQLLGEIDEDLKLALSVDTEGVYRRMTRFGFPAKDWKPFRLYDGSEVLVPGAFNVTIDERGDTLLHPLGDRSNPPSARMPNGGYFFDAIIRQQPFEEEQLDPADNLEEYGPISEEELAHLEREARRAASTGRLVVANFGGTAFGDIALIPGVVIGRVRTVRRIGGFSYHKGCAAGTVPPVIGFFLPKGSPCRNKDGQVTPIHLRMASKSRRLGPPLRNSRRGRRYRAPSRQVLTT